MNRIFRSGLIAAVMLLAASAALAQDEDETGWSGKGELGLVRTTGNTETESLTFRLNFTREQEDWRHSARFNALSSEDSGEDTAQRYGFEWQSDYKLSDKSWVLGNFRYESDEFSAYDNQQTLTIGYGWQLLDSAKHQLKGEAGIGYRDAELITGESQSDAIFKGVLDYAMTVTDNTQFTNRLAIEAGSDNTFLQNLAGLSVSMNDRFAMKFGYEYRHNTDVPFGTDDTDTITSANLVVNFD